jgi:pimeloyl-ACP methyl ester carboxylesterase
MPYTTNARDGVRVHYEVVGAGMPLLMHIGFFGRIHGWYRTGYVDALRDEYQLIMLDPRGQGESDKPHDPGAYDRRHFVGDVVAILDELEIRKAHYLGYSMGAKIGYAVGVFASDRFLSLMLGGSTPNYGEGGTVVAPTVREDAELLQQGVAAFVERVEDVYGPLHPQQRELYLQEDGEALAANLLADETQLDITDQLPNVTLPTLIYCGTNDERIDGARQASEMMPNARFVALEGANHMQAFSQSELVLPHIRSFLASVDRPA